jgi:hypothetical protein
MGSYLFKLGLFGMLVLFGVIAVFLGVVTGYSALQTGELTYVSGKSSATVARLADPSGFWRGVVLASALPIVGGIAAVWFGRRGLAGL